MTDVVTRAPAAPVVGSPQRWAWDGFWVGGLALLGALPLSLWPWSAHTALPMLLQTAAMVLAGGLLGSGIAAGAALATERLRRARLPLPLLGGLGVGAGMAWGVLAFTAVHAVVNQTLEAWVFWMSVPVGLVVGGFVGAVVWLPWLVASVLRSGRWGVWGLALAAGELGVGLLL